MRFCRLLGFKTLECKICAVSSWSTGVRSRSRTRQVASLGLEAANRAVHEALTGCSAPQAMSALLAAKQKGDPSGWRAFQERAHALRSRRARARREAEDLEASLFAAQTALRLQTEGAIGTSCAGQTRHASWLSRLCASQETSRPLRS